MLRSDLVVLGFLDAHEAKDDFHSLSLDEIMDESDMKVDNLRLRLRSLMKLDMVKEGIKDGNKKTYYITQKGIDFINRK